MSMVFKVVIHTVHACRYNYVVNKKKKSVMHHLGSVDTLCLCRVLE